MDAPGPVSATSTAPPHVRLVVVFNHRYEANLAKLDEIYGERFPDRVHLMPFYTGARPDVLRVLETSFCFQGYLAQAFDAFASPEVTHYVIVADDLLLHPSLHSGNIVEALGLDDDTAYVKQLIGIGNHPLTWPHMKRALTPFLERNGVDWSGLLPTPDEALASLARHGVDLGVHGWSDVQERALRGSVGRRARWALGYLAKGRGRRVPPYPLAVSYSDLAVVPAKHAEAFLRLCGVTAAMGVFVEAALPTALALTVPRVRTEADTRWRGLELWEPGADTRLVADHGGSFPALQAAFSDDQLYLHPVKLSRWQGPFA